MATNKVTIEITPDGWQTTVEFEGKTYVEKHVLTPTGASGTEGSFDDEDELPDELIEELTSGNYAYSIARALLNNS
jgi:hypothetical protein